MQTNSVHLRIELSMIIIIIIIIVSTFQLSSFKDFHESYEY